MSAMLPDFPARRFTAALLVLLAATPVVCRAQSSKYGQFAPDDAYRDGSPLAYYGSENEWTRRQFTQEKSDKVYGRRGQRQLLATLDGRPQQTIELAGARLAVDPQDLEAMFTRTIALCQLGDTTQALASAQKAVAAGLPVERFLAGPRDLLRPLVDLAEFQEFVDGRAGPLLHGPMLGCVGPVGAQIWVRLAEAQDVEAVVFACDSSGEPGQTVVASASRRAAPTNDFTAVLKVAGLQPDACYAYDIRVAGESALAGRLPTFRTLPTAGTPLRFKFAFGGGAGYTPEFERMWQTIDAVDPDALLLLGDNVYIDLAEEPRGLHQYTYYRRQSRPEFRRLVSGTPVYAIWDDHDCAIDDVWMGPYLDQPAWKPAMLRVFQQNWVNPGYGTPTAPGCWFGWTAGDIEFFFLDCRYYRTNPFGERPTMLGPEQKAWLLKGLRRSRATLKIIVSAVAWAPDAKPGSRDTWDGFREEREDIFSTLEQNKIDGVVLVSADRHRTDIRQIDRSDGYSLYDFMSSKLTNLHTHECVDGAIACYNEECSFGLMTLDTTVADPRVHFEIVSIDGEQVDAFTLRGSDLQH